MIIQHLKIAEVLKDYMNNLFDHLSKLSPPLLCYLMLIDHIHLYKYIKEMKGHAGNINN